MGQIKLTLTYADGLVFESGYAVRQDRGAFIYTVTQNAIDSGPVTIRVVADEHERNTIVAERRRIV